MVELSDAMIRIGVTSYLYTKPEELLQRPRYSTVNDVIPRNVNQLDKHRRLEGLRGDTVISWNPDSSIFKQ